MGDASSTYAAYQQLRPIADKSLDNLLKVEQLIASREGRRAKKEKTAADAAAKEEAEINKMLKESGLSASLENVFTGIKTLDQSLMLGAANVADERTELQNKIAKGELNPNSPDVADRINNLNAWPKKIRSATDIMTKEYANFKKLKAEGKISKWDYGKEKLFDSFFGKVNPDTGEIETKLVFLNDKRGNPYVVSPGEDGKNNILGINEINNGNVDLFSTREPIDYETYLDTAIKHATKLGTRIDTRLKGQYLVTEQKFDSHKDEVIGESEEIFGTSDNPTDFAKGVWADKLGRDPKDLDEEGIDEMQVDYVRDVKSFYNEKYSETLDPTYERQQARIKKEREAAAKKAATVKGDELFLELETDIDGVPVLGKIPGVGPEIDLQGDAYIFSLPKDNKGKRQELKYIFKGKERIVDNLYFTKNRKIVFVGSVKDKKASRDSGGDLTGKYEYTTSPFTKGGNRIDDLTEFNEVARILGFKNVGGLYKHMEERVSFPPYKEKRADTSGVSETEEEFKLEGEPTGETKKTITRADLDAAAVEAGYTTEKEKKEYEKILIENGIKITK